MEAQESGPSLHIITPRPSGRPRQVGDEPGSSVSAWLSASEHDRLIRFAQTQRMSVSACVRLLVVANLSATARGFSTK